MAVLTSGELAIVRAASHASADVAAPVTCTVTSLVAPSPPRTTSRARWPATAPGASRNAGSSPRGTTTPELPEASANTQSFVEHSPSTVIALNDRSTTWRSAWDSTPGSTLASVVKKASIVAIRGSIIPEPLAMPPTVIGPPGESTTTAYDFGNGSVVMIARVAASWPSMLSAADAAVTPARIFPRSSGTPITPVDAIRTCSGAQPSEPAAAAAMSRATCSPASPVHAFAQPLLTAITLARPPDFERCSRDTIIGAATALLVVNTAAAETGSSAAMSAKSSGADALPAARRLMPQATPAARKPAGAVTPPSI